LKIILSGLLSLNFLRKLKNSILSGKITVTGGRVTEVDAPGLRKKNNRHQIIFCVFFDYLMSFALIVLMSSCQVSSFDVIS
jgi:hypothetical protein